jgi:hypothetical protein
VESEIDFEIVSCRNVQCRQQLRIPAGEMLQVTCPTCQTSFTYRPGQPGKRLSEEFQSKAWTLAELLLAISRESMMLIKRQAPALSNMPRKQEWEGFVEVLKVLFNLGDRVAALYVPVKEYLQFLDAVEDAVIDQMNAAFRKQAGPEYDEVPLKVSIAAAFEDSQKFYQPHRFMITDESAEKDKYLKAFGEALAVKLGAKGNGMIVTTATMCAGSSIAAMKALMESAEGFSSTPSGTA